MTYTPAVERTCHVINNIREASVLANERVFVVPEDE
jgi:hypothetical protein